MPITLADFETGAKHAGEYSDDLTRLQEALAQQQAAAIVHGRPVIVLVEGWDASGKGGVIQRLCAEWDPRYFEVFPIAAPSDEEKRRHFLYRFWKRLPGKGEIAVFDRSWYGRVLVERIEGYASDAEWARGYDEINEFEAQQADGGAVLIKLFMHITQSEQDKRLAARLDDPWKRWKTGADDYRNRAKRAAYLAAYDEMFARTDTRWAPWTVIDGNNKKAARIAALTHVVEVLRAKLPQTPPPADPALEKLAAAAFGYKRKG